MIDERELGTIGHGDSCWGGGSLSSPPCHDAEEAEAFPPLLVMPGMVDYVATVFIPRRFVEGVTEANNISAHGTSIEMAIQEVAYKAMAILRQEVIELEYYCNTPVLIVSLILS